MKESADAVLYKTFGKLVRMHRERLLPEMTQDKLGRIVGLSRTSITNIEKGRQHVSLHQLYAIADALRVQPDVLLPARGKTVSTAQVRVKLTSVDEDISGWAEKVVTGKS